MIFLFQSKNQETSKTKKSPEINLSSMDSDLKKNDSKLFDQETNSKINQNNSIESIESKKLSYFFCKKPRIYNCT